MANYKRRSYPNLQTWRGAQGLNQREAAELLQLSQTLYSRLERRAMFVKGQRAKYLTEATGVPLEVLVGAA